MFATVASTFELHVKRLLAMENLLLPALGALWDSRDS